MSNELGPEAKSVLEALRQAGLDENDEVWKKAVAFISRCQNSSRSMN